VQFVLDHDQPRGDLHPPLADGQIRRQPSADAGIFPDYPARVVRNAGDAEEMVLIC
jgi:hypothetical protein